MGSWVQICPNQIFDIYVVVHLYPPVGWFHPAVDWFIPPSQKKTCMCFIPSLGKPETWQKCTNQLQQATNVEFSSVQRSYVRNTSAGIAGTPATSFFILNISRQSGWMFFLGEGGSPVWPTWVPIRSQEIVMRMSFLKCRKYWCGPDRCRLLMFLRSHRLLDEKTTSYTRVVPLCLHCLSFLSGASLKTITLKWKLLWGSYLTVVLLVFRYVLSTAIFLMFFWAL